MQERIQKPRPEVDRQHEVEHVEAVAKKIGETSVTSELTDELLDEIDEVLETNAEEFVKAYVQKGGE